MPHSRLIKVLLLFAALQPAQVLAAPQPIKDLNYGVTLYSFYQDDYFDAISELMRAELHGGIKGHGVEPLLLKGGIMLSYGITRQAETIFNKHIADASPQTRDEAWYYVGKLATQRGDLDAAAKAFKRVGANLPSHYADDFHLLSGTTDLQLNNTDAAIRQLKAVGENSAHSGYAQYNIGVAQRQRKHVDSAIEAFDDAMKLSNSSIEQRALMDIAALAKAEIYVEKNDLGKALGAYRQVSLEGPFSNQGLLEYGWTALKHGDIKLALAPWQTLVKHDVLDPFAQEALLGLPYAYERLHADGAAANAYETAAKQYALALAHLDIAQQELQKTSWTAYLLPLKSHRTKASDGSRIENTEFSMRALLANLLPQHPFQHGLNNLRDIAKLQQLKGTWIQDLESLSTMIDTRSEAFKKVSNTFDPTTFQNRVTALLNTRDTLDAALRNSKNTNDIAAICTAQESAQMALIIAIEKKAQRLSETQKTAILERCKRLRGVISWRVQDTKASRIWSTQKRLNELSSLIQNTKVQLENIAESRDIAANSKNTSAAQLAQKRKSITIFEKQLNEVTDQQADALQALAQAEIDFQRKRIKHYLAYARLALTRLYDKTPEQPRQ